MYVNGRTAAKNRVDGSGRGDLLLHQLVVVGLGGPAAERPVEGERHPGVGGVRVQRVVPRVVVRPGREARDEPGPCTLSETAIELGDAHVDPVVDRQHREPHDVFRCGTLELVQHPVVVRAHAGEGELPIRFDVGEDRVVGVDDRHVDTVATHVVDMGGTVVVAGQDLVEPQPREPLPQVLATRRRFDAEASLGGPTVEAPPVAAVGGALQLREAIAERTGCAVEHVRRFVHVAVGRDHSCRSTRFGLTRRARGCVVRSCHADQLLSMVGPAVEVTPCALEPSSCEAGTAPPRSRRSTWKRRARARCSCASLHPASAGRTCTSCTVAPCSTRFRWCSGTKERASWKQLATV